MCIRPLFANLVTYNTSKMSGLSTTAKVLYYGLNYLMDVSVTTVSSTLGQHWTMKLLEDGILGLLGNKLIIAQI